jgi:hypothetical protein
VSVPKANSELQMIGRIRVRLVMTSGVNSESEFLMYLAPTLLEAAFPAQAHSPDACAHATDLDLAR